MNFQADLPVCFADDEIQLYSMDLAEPFEADFFKIWLNDAERARAERLNHEPSRQRFMRVRAGLRWLLGRYLQIDPASVAFAIGDKGKPRLADAKAKELAFNVSHSDHRAVIALGRHQDLGVDIEAWRLNGDLQKLAKRCFSTEELIFWRGLAQNERIDAFFSFWTAKEAFVKATGLGISLGLKRCVIDLCEFRLVSIPNELGGIDEWTLHRLDLGPHMSGAVCVKGALNRIQRADLKFIL